VSTSKPACEAALTCSAAGLKLEGATWSADGHLTLNDGSTIALGRSSLVWLESATAQDRAQDGTTDSSVPVTVYLNGDRGATLFSLALPAAQGLVASTVAQRAVALRAA
jgi:hypothetical protein